MNRVIRRLRFERLKKTFRSIGADTRISSDNTFFGAEGISIGEHCSIEYGGTWVGHGGIAVGNHVIIACGVYILSRNHRYDGDELEGIPFDKEHIHKPVVIGDNVWIGAHVRIAPGVTIGEGAVVGLGAVVVRDVPPMAVVGGNPAKILKYRDEEKYQMLKAQNRFYDTI